MKISLLTMGTFGDIRPFLALAYGLEERGHQVTLAGPENFADYVATAYKRPYVPIGLNSQKVLESEEGRRWMAAGNAKQFLNEMAKISHEKRYEVERDTAVACSDCELIVAHPLMTYQGCILSEKLRKPLVIANTFPTSPATSAFPHFLTTAKKLPFGFMNKATYRVFSRVYEKSLRQDMNEWRGKLDLAPMRGTLYTNLERQKVPVLQAFSRELLPAGTAWDDYVEVTGQWKIPERHIPVDEKAELPADLVAWLQEGPPPIYFGFGSLPVLEPRKMIEMAIRITDTLRTRAIIASGWSSMDVGDKSLPDTLRMIPFANHERLFPRCSAIIHHGGAGTTHTAAESGTPSIVCSTYADQPFWGERIAEKGIGKHIPFAKLTQDKLLRAIKELQTPAVRAKAAETAQRIRTERGLEQALNWLERVAPSAPVYQNSPS